MPVSQFILKIFSGAYAGAELALGDASYVMGRSLDCDIAVDDEQLADEALEIHILDSQNIQIDLIGNDKKVGCNGLLQKQSSFVVQPYDRIQIGDFVFAIGLSGAAWPDYPPLAELIEPIDLNDKSESFDDEETEFSTLDESSVGFAEAWDADEETVREEEKKISVHEPLVMESKKETSILDALMEHRLMIAGLGLAITLASGLLVLTLGSHREYQDTVSSEQEKIPTALAAHSMMKLAAMKPAASMQFSVQQNQELLSSIKDLLDSFNLSQLNASIGTSPGEVIVTGYVEDLDQWRKVSKIIQRDVMDLKKLTDQVETPQKNREKLEKIIAEHGLSGSVEVLMTNQGLVAKASLSPEDEAKWALIEQEYAQVSPDQPEIHRIRDNGAELDIKSVSFGYESYVIMADGNRYVVGSVMKNGYTLESITPEGLVLRNGSSVKHYSL